VRRADQVTVKGLNPKGKEVRVKGKGLLARALQHEIDHLDGVLAVDRAHGTDPFCLREEWNRLYTASDRYGTPEPRNEQMPTALSALL
jgi:peptide deformylase